MGDNYSEIFNRGSFEFAFFWFKREAVLLENLHNPMDNFPMLLQGFSEYEDVIQIYHYNSFGNQVLKILSIIVWKVAGLLVKPKYITSGS